MPPRKKLKSTKASDCRLSGTQTQGEPRRDQRQRLLSRFYEPLVLLRTLGQTRGERISRPSSGEPVDLANCQLRRSFLDYLAYTCDYEKGGDTVTAIALERTPQGPIYWISANKNLGQKVIQFLEKTLKKLQDVAQTPGKDASEEAQLLSKDFVFFARSRIKKYWSCLARCLQNCFNILSSQESDKDNGQGLLVWLKLLEFDPAAPLLLCQWCYEARKAPQMSQLRIWSQRHIYCNDRDLRSNPFEQAKHYIGRLGYHFRAAAHLVATARRLPYLLEGYEIRCVETPPPSRHPPSTDSKTRFDSIVIRMLPFNAKDDVKRYQSMLAHMSEKFDFYSRFMSFYKDPNFLPRVHCEINLLEHFHTKRLPFVDSDRYIGCSKPACYCCLLYIRNHPGCFVEPASHQKIYLNWRPPDLDLEDKDKAQIHQRNMLNSMIPVLRKEALHQISERGSPVEWHPDSTTGVTVSDIPV
ncbi:hypothetical protein B0J12DRAFT_687231 [Macrophomina phaseolina]|uniref:Uncharacterized protein n=1 Tax=Macrophomina phaseolina TaxID=35725 RepID=A0ABQ8FSK8_9PEZI|nr:hypothetical protein B0J12DRAFT_687231 [Macrophomina phaseolina]